MSEFQSSAGTGGATRVAITISGGTSLGAFEAGALSAVLAGLGALRSDPEPTVVDVLTGASAGAVNALLAAHCLVTGADPVFRLHQAWVRRASLPGMLAPGTDGPLSLGDVSRLADRYFAGPDDEVTLASAPAASTTGDPPVRLQLALSALGGSPGDPAGDEATVPNHLVWAEFDVSGDTAVATWSEALAATLASSANPYAFGPGLVRLGREGGDAQPQWCTDGGVLDNEPLGRAIEHANTLDERAGAGRRLHLLIHPYPPEPPTRGWRDSTVRPRWLDTIGRTGEVQREQSLRDDLEQVARTNERIRASANLAEALTKVDGDAKRRIIDALADPPCAPGGDLDRALDWAVRRAADVEGKHPVVLHTISPHLLVGAPGETATSARQLLSGDFLAGFGGFASARFRQNDFDLGYRCGLHWLRAQEEAGELPAGVGRAARTAYWPGLGYRQTGGATVRHLRLLELGRLGRLAARTGWLILVDTVARDRRQARMEQRAAPARPGRRSRGPGKRLHPTGTVFAARFTPRAGTPLSPLFLEPGAPVPPAPGLAAAVRVSRTRDLPVLRRFIGLAVKIDLGEHGPYSDLLMVSSSPTRWGRKWGKFATDVFQVFYGSLLTIDVEGRRLLVGARSVGAPGRCTFEELCAGAAVPPLHFDLLVAEPGGDWITAGELTLTRQVVDDRRRLRFSPARSGRRFRLPGLNGVRTAIYRRLQPPGDGLPVGAMATAAPTRR